MTITFVSAYYDINHNKSTKNYIDNFKCIPIQEIPYLIIFTDQKTLKNIESEIKENNRVKIITSELLSHQYCLSKNNKEFKRPSNKKFTDAYINLGHHKIEFLKKAIDADYFKTKLFAWIDFGIMHVSKTTNIELREIISAVKSKIKICCIDFFPIAELTNKALFYSNFNHYIAAGFITGSSQNILELYRLYKIEYEIMISHKVFALEEAILSVLVEENPDLFELYFGGYCCLFQNYIRYIKSPEYILEIMQRCCNTKQYNKGYKFLLTIIKSLRHGKIVISSTNKQQILDTAFIIITQFTTNEHSNNIYSQLLDFI